MDDPKRNDVEANREACGRTLALLQRGGRWSVADLTAELARLGWPYAQTGVSANTRNLRKPRYGGHAVKGERCGDGEFRYSLGKVAPTMARVEPVPVPQEPPPCRHWWASPDLPCPTPRPAAPGCHECYVQGADERHAHRCRCGAVAW
jgi:hypothetical protein